MRLSDENTREGRHLTPEERIALQAEEIKQLWQENKQLRAQLDEWKYEAKCHMDEVAARDKEIERLKAQVDTLSATVNMLAPDEIGKECRHIEALRKAREALCKGISELKVHCKYFDNTPEEDACIEMHEAILEIDKAIGGKEDVTSMGN